MLTKLLKIVGGCVLILVIVVVCTCIQALCKHVAAMHQPFLHSHATALFKDDVSITDNSSKVEVGTALALVSDYHHGDGEGLVSRFKRNKVIVMNGKPHENKDLSKVSGIDLVVTANKDPLLAPKPVTTTTPCLYLPRYASFLEEIGIHPQVLTQPVENQPGARRLFAASCGQASADFHTLLQAKKYRSVETVDEKQHFTILAQFKFVLAFEDQAITGYISEQMVKPLLAGTVPVYFGAPDVNEHFNPKRFINVQDFKDFEACIDELIRLDGDDEAYRAILREPCFFKNELNKVNFALQLGGEFYNELYLHVPNIVRVRPSMITSNTVWFVTCGPPDVTSRSMKAAQSSGCFDECVSYQEQDWRPAVLCLALSRAADNDLVVFCGALQSVHPSAEHEMVKYYRMVLYNGDCDVLVFVNKAVMMVRKTWSSVKFVCNWAESSSGPDAQYPNMQSVRGDFLFFMKTF